MEGFAPETLAWLKEHPEWDPRVRLAHPSMRASIKADLAAHGAEAYGGHPLAKVDGELIGDNEFDGLYGRISQVNGLCRAAEGMSLDLAAMRFSLELAAELDAELGKEEGEKDDKGGDKPKPKPGIDPIADEERMHIEELPLFFDLLTLALQTPT